MKPKRRYPGNILMRPLIILLLLFFSILSLTAQEEKMISFHADVSLGTTGMTTVREQIRIYAAGEIYSGESPVLCRLAAATGTTTA